MTSQKKTVTLHEGVADVLRDALHRVEVQSKCTEQATSYEELVRAQREVIEHQGSLLRNLVVRLVGSDFDGDLDLFVDGTPLSLFWRHPKSGYHGGLLYHQDAKDECTGRWQSHT